MSKMMDIRSDNPNGVSIFLINEEYATLMGILKQALIDENFGPRHEQLSAMYHDLGMHYGYAEEV